MTVFELSHRNLIASLGESYIALGSFVTCVTPVPGPTLPVVALERLSQQPFIPLRSGGLPSCALVAPSWATGAQFISRKNGFTITVSRSFNSKRSHVMEKLDSDDMRSHGCFYLE